MSGYGGDRLPHCQPLEDHMLCPGIATNPTWATERECDCWCHTDRTNCAAFQWDCQGFWGDNGTPRPACTCGRCPA